MTLSSLAADAPPSAIPPEGGGEGAARGCAAGGSSSSESSAPIASSPGITLRFVRASQIEARAVSKITFTTLACLALGAIAVYAVLHTTTTIRWVVTAIFLALALDPAVGLVERVKLRGRTLPRALAILFVYLLFFGGLVALILHVAPPLVREIEALAKKLPTYVTDFENWAEDNKQFADLNDRYDLTAKLSDQASSLPSTLSSGASEIGSATVSLLEHVIAFITIVTLTFFLLLGGSGMFQRGTGRLDAPHRDRFTVGHARGGVRGGGRRTYAGRSCHSYVVDRRLR